MVSVTAYPKAVTWDYILERMRSGEYLQAQGAMCREHPDATYAYCPLGIVALLSGATFELHSGGDILCDDNGEEGVPDANVLSALGLDKIMTEEELASCWNYRTAMEFYYEGEVRRYEAIAFMNDNLGLRFEKIADEIERLGWDK